MLDPEARWVTLHVHDWKVAIDEGIAVQYLITRGGATHRVYITDRVCEAYREKYRDRSMPDDIIAGIDMLSVPTASDTEYLKQREIEDILIVQSRDDVIFLTHDDW